MKKILICDDALSTRERVRELLCDIGADVELCPDPRRAVVLGTEQAFDVVLSDARFRHPLSGIDLLAAIKAVRPTTEVILMSATASLDLALEAMRRGAFDLVSKPIDVDMVRRLVQRALRADDGSGALEPATAESPSESTLVGSSPKMLGVYKSIALVADSKASVLIQGESGTGKELVAHAIHANGERRFAPFVAVHCGALTETLLSSELFGYVRGAFTGASSDKDGLFHAADRGTIFLDELAETSHEMQVKLLRFLQDEEYTPVGSTQARKADVRVIAASNRDLESMVREGRFREDLLYRLNVVNLEMPPLRERSEDIPQLIAHFVHRVRARGLPAPRFSPKALDWLIRYPWPGNVRELENAIERLALFHRGRLIEPEDLHETLSEPSPFWSVSLFEGLPPLAAVVRAYLLHVLQKVRGNRKRAAKVMGIDRRTLYRMMDRFALRDGQAGLTPEGFSPPSRGETSALDASRATRTFQRNEPL